MAFFSHFKNGFNAFLWCCSHMTLKRSKVPLTNVTCKHSLSRERKRKGKPANFFLKIWRGTSNEFTQWQKYIYKTLYMHKVHVQWNHQSHRFSYSLKMGSMQPFGAGYATLKRSKVPLTKTLTVRVNEPQGLRPVHTNHQHYRQHNECYVDGQINMQPNLPVTVPVKKIKGATRQHNVVTLGVNRPLKCENVHHKGLFTLTVCIYICVWHKEWNPWQQVKVFTLDISIFKNGIAKIKE